jgi:hypothetical protein
MNGNSAITTVALVVLRAGVSAQAGIAGEDYWAFRQARKEFGVEDMTGAYPGTMNACTRDQPVGQVSGFLLGLASLV